MLSKVSHLRREAKRTFLFSRGWIKSAASVRSRRGRIKNIYHTCIQKTGSQWVKTIFADPKIRKLSGLKVHPQFRYEVDQFKKKFPLYTFVPGLYIPYYLYNEIKKPERSRTFYVMRDPREVIVSWYYSMKYTHRATGNVMKHRNALQEVSESEGLFYAIKHLHIKVAFMRTWWHNRSDPDVHVVRFENLTEEPLEEWRKIFDHCMIDIGDSTLKRVLSRYTKNKMRERDLKRRNGSRSHYRTDKKGWQILLEDQHLELFKRANGNILKELEYE